jgi:hypothetical protein
MVQAGWSRLASTDVQANYQPRTVMLSEHHWRVHFVNTFCTIRIYMFNEARIVLKKLFVKITGVEKKCFNVLMVVANGEIKTQ